MNPEQSKIQILDKSLKYGFCQIPRPVIKAKGLSRNAKCLYSLLLDYAWQTGHCFPGQKRLADDLDVDVRTIQRDLKELKDFKLIDWKARRKNGVRSSNDYYILSIDFLCSTNTTEVSSSEVTNLSSCNTTRMSQEEYNVEKTHLKNTQSLDNENLNLDNFDKKAVLIAQDLDDIKSIKYYQKIVIQEKKGQINSQDLDEAWEFARREKRRDFVDGMNKLKKPGALFNKFLKELIEKRQRVPSKSNYLVTRERFIKRTPLNSVESFTKSPKDLNQVEELKVNINSNSKSNYELARERLLKKLSRNSVTSFTKTPEDLNQIRNKQLKELQEQQ